MGGLGFSVFKFVEVSGPEGGGHTIVIRVFGRSGVKAIRFGAIKVLGCWGVDAFAYVVKGDSMCV